MEVSSQVHTPGNFTQKKDHYPADIRLSEALRLFGNNEDKKFSTWNQILPGIKSYLFSE
jgi:hypothetical protein